MTVLVKCTNGEETVLACGEIGEWDNVTGDICADTCEVPLLGTYELKFILNLLGL